MGCGASKAPQKRDPVEELIEEVHAQQGRESGGGVTLDLSAAPASADAPAGKLAELGLSLKGKVPDAAWACGAVRAAFPDAAFVALVDSDGRVLCAERTPPAAPFGRIAGDLVRRRDAPALFDALGGGDRAAAVVSNDMVWLVASDELRDDDRAWVAALLES